MKIYKTEPNYVSLFSWLVYPPLFNKILFTKRYRLTTGKVEVDDGYKCSNLTTLASEIETY